MMFINHFGVVVSDMDRMLEFYQEGFGFEIARVISPGPKSKMFSDDEAEPARRVPRVVMMRAGNCYLEVMENVADADPKPAASGYVQMCLEVTDIEGQYSRLRDFGVDFVQPSPIDLGYVKVLTGFDPEGNQLELVETKPEYVASFDRIINQIVEYRARL